MTSLYINPFDLRTLLIDFFLGSTELFALMFILVYSFVAAKFGFSNKIYFFLLVIGMVIMAATLGTGWYIIIIGAAGAFVFKTLASAFTR